jgi:hypothetical protein
MPRAFDPRRGSLGDAKARRELAYAPRALEEGLRETLLYEMAQLGMTAKPDKSTPRSS